MGLKEGSKERMTSSKSLVTLGTPRKMKRLLFPRNSWTTAALRTSSTSWILFRNGIFGPMRFFLQCLMRADVPPSRNFFVSYLWPLAGVSSSSRAWITNSSNSAGTVPLPWACPRMRSWAAYSGWRLRRSGEATEVSGPRRQD